MTERFENGYALLIGVDQNHVPKWGLPDVAKDITALAAILTHPERCAYPRGNVKTIRAKEATRQGILDGLEWLQECLQADQSGNATAVVYYTGHGWRDISTQPLESYFIPYDVREGKIGARALRAEDFAEAIEELKPRRLLVVLDCCHAAGMGIKDIGFFPTSYAAAAVPASLLMKGEEISLGPTAIAAKGMEELAQGSGRAVLSSSTGEQRSYIRKDGQMSIFTYHLIESLTGHAQPEEGATEVLVSDVMSHVWRHVPRSAMADWGKKQEPDYQVSGNFPIALLLGGKGLGKGQPAPDPFEAAKPIDSITVSGDFVGRDKIVHGDEVHGDKVLGNKVSGIKVGNVTDSTGVVIGHDIDATMYLGPSSDEISRLFASIYQQIDARPEDPDVNKEEIAGTVHKIEREIRKGDKANPSKVERWLKTLALMASDILEVTVACLSSPETGVATVIREVVQKVREEAETT